MTAAWSAASVVRALVAAAVERRGVGEVQAVRGGHVLLEGVRAAPATGRKWKMPPPSLLSSTMVSDSPSRRAASRPPMSWARATSPISSTTGPLAHRGGAERGRDGAVDPVGAAVGQHPRVLIRAPGRAARRRGWASRRRRRALPSAGATRSARAATSGSESSSPSGGARAPVRRSRRPHASCPASPDRGPRRAARRPRR